MSDASEIGPRVPHPVFYEWCRKIMALFAWLARARVTGRHHVPDEGPFILACNHRSYADPPMLAPITKRPYSFVAKEELFKIPLLGRLIRLLNAFPVRRGKADLRALRTALRVLHAGRGVVIFPEGMRSPDEHLLQPELGVALVALKSRAPVLPVGLDGTERVLPRGCPILLPRRFTISVGKPITFDDLYDKRPSREDLEYVARTIMEGIAEQLGQTFEWKPEEREGEAASSL